jgi:hypothetical protein
MMRVVRFILGVLAAIAGAFAGNWIGGQIRYLLTGQTTQTIHFVHTTAKGQNLDSYPVATKFYPALLLALLGKPRWLFAFLGGTLTGLLVDDRYEVIWLERVIVPLIVERIPKQVHE